MRKLFTVLLLCFSALAFKAVAQYDTVHITGTLDTAILGKQVTVYQFPVVNNTTVATDTAGVFSIKMPAKDSTTGKIIFSLVNCAGDTVFVFADYDVTAGDDTINVSLKNCDTTCKNYSAQLSYTVMKREAGFNNLSSPSADFFWWDFGDGTISAAQAPSHSYNADGSYAVYLLAQDTGSGCQSMKISQLSIKNYTVYIKTIFDSSVIRPFTILYNDPFAAYTDTTFATDGAGTFFEPLIVDSTAAKSITLQTLNCGGDTLTLTGSFANELDTVSFNVAYCPPCAKFKTGYDYSITGSTVFFADTSKGLPLPNNFSWDFGDYKYNSSALQYPAHRYTTVDSDTMKVTVTMVAFDTASGCMDTVTKLITFAGLAADSLLVTGKLDTAIAGQPIRITTLLDTVTVFTDATGAYSAYVFSDTVSDIISAFTFDCFGDSIINLAGYSHISDTVIIDFKYCDLCKPFYADFTYTQTGSTLFFADTSSINATNYNWQFGDYKYNTSTQKNTFHRYTTVDSSVMNITVMLIAKDSVNNCIDTAIKQISFNGPATDSVLVKGNIDSLLAGHPVILTYPLSLPSVKTVFTDANGDYLAYIQVDSAVATILGKINDCYGDTANGNGSYNHISDTVIINFQYCDLCALLTADFAFNNDSDRVFSFTNNSVAATSYEWDFGDGNTDITTHPVNNYTSDGSYTTCLIAVDKVNNCYDTLCKSLSVYTTLSGKVSMNLSAVPPDTAIIWLIRRDSASSGVTYTISDSVVINTADGGKYVFNKVKPGKYIIKASLLLPSAYIGNWLPTYYGPAALWDSAVIITRINSLQAAAADITLNSATTFSGPGFIGGYVLNTSASPLTGISVVLVSNAGTPLKHAYTDTSGQYRFDNLSDVAGTYNVLADVPGLPSDRYTIDFDANHLDASNRNFEVNSTRVNKIFSPPGPGAGITKTQEDRLILYPNPATGHLNILLRGQPGGKMKITIADMAGKEVYTANREALVPGGPVTISLEGIKTGLYIIQVEAEGRQYKGRVSISR